ncbi:hypothetical protein V1264_003492 [Littorina saxatilis]|uniref:Uncharacterized protein n=2 Tax=Littorina saxatilis TaxID=31220 RepID=A0AAN9B4V9_9CAEN
MVPKDDKSMCLLKIGENCTAAGSECMVGTTCKEQTCMCPENSGPNTAKDKCLMYVGGQCAESGDCVQGVNVVCNSSKCACTSNKYAPSDMMDMCKLKLNQTCTNADECGMNTVCSTTCACEANYVAEENRCGMKVGGACTGDTHCVMNAECKSEKCACSGTYTSDGDYCKSGSAAVVASLLLLVAALVTSRLM